MVERLLPLLVAFGLALPRPVWASDPRDDLGAWLMYFYSWRFEDTAPWGVQGDAQFRFWDLGGDLEQILLRSGLTYAPTENVVLTLGLANITTGEIGPSDDTVNENRLYQEVLLSQVLGGRVYVRHRFRSEQRWNQDQDFRTRYRYAVFVNVPLSDVRMTQGTVYAAFYNEVFLNGERDIGDGRTVALFDRNRLYGALGYGLADGLGLQAGYMLQTTDPFQKGQLQLSLHQTF